MDVEWDPEKATANLRSHGVDFADAVGVFEDVHALSREDPQAHGKQRFVAVGMAFLGRCSPSSIPTAGTASASFRRAERPGASEPHMSASDNDMEMQEEYDFSDARRGPIIPPASGKTRITIRLDSDILEWFRAQVHRQGGGNYQTLINRALRAYIECDRVPLEEMLRRVIREELQRTH